MTSSTHVRPDFDHTFLLSPVDADLRSGADHGIFVQCEVSATPGDAEFLAFSAGEIIEHVFTKIAKVLVLFLKFCQPAISTAGISGKRDFRRRFSPFCPHTSREAMADRRIPHNYCCCIF